MELCTIPSRVKTHFPLHSCLLPKFQNSKCWVLHSARCGTPCKYSTWNLPAIIKMSPLHHSCSWIFGFDAMVGITRSKVILRSHDDSGPVSFNFWTHCSQHVPLRPKPIDSSLKMFPTPNIPTFGSRVASRCSHRVGNPR